MSDSLHHNIEEAVQNAFDVLKRSGEIADFDDASRFLVKTIATLATNGERRQLILVNRAIDAYRRHVRIGLSSDSEIKEAAKLLACWTYHQSSYNEDN